MFASFSSWQNSFDNRIVLIGDKYPAANASIQRRDQKFVTDHVEQWSKQGPLEVFGEAWLEPVALQASPLPPASDLPSASSSTDDASSSDPSSTDSSSASSSTDSSSSSSSSSSSESKEEVTKVQKEKKEKDKQKEKEKKKKQKEKKKKQAEEEKKAEEEKQEENKETSGSSNNKAKSKHGLKHRQAEAERERLRPISLEEGSQEEVKKSIAMGVQDYDRLPAHVFRHVLEQGVFREQDKEKVVSADASASSSSDAAAAASSSVASSSVPSASTSYTSSIYPTTTLHLTPAQPFTHVSSFLLMAITFWQSQPDSFDEDEESKGKGKEDEWSLEQERFRVQEFLDKCRDCTFEELFGCIEQVVLRMSEAIVLMKKEKYPGFEVVEEFINGRMDLLGKLVEMAQSFVTEFSANGEKDRYSVVFFRAVEIQKEQAIQKWTAFAENLGIISRQLSLFAQLFTFIAAASSSSTSDSSASASSFGTRAVVMCDNNIVVACSDILTKLGFSCRGFSGSMLQTSIYQVKPGGPAGSDFEKRHLEKIFASAFKFPPPVLQFCSVCQKPDAKLCSRCQTVRYCSANCQKTAWPTHKAQCKLVKSQN